MPKTAVKTYRSLLTFNACIFVLYLVVLILLAYSVFRSGYYYTFDNDEYLHAHVVYLIDHGKLMFRDIFSVYTPIFHWFLLPVYKLYGYSLDTIQFSRYVMILLFVLRLAAGGYIALRIFGKRAAMLFLALHLLDPFAVFTNMQIRPDNLMLTAYSLGLAGLVTAVSKKSTIWWILAAVGFSVSVLTNIKIIPIAGISAFLTGIYLLRQRRVLTFIWFIAGGVIPIVLFLGYFLFQGTLTAMIQQIAFDARLTNETRLFPVPPGFFYHPNNILVYGAPERPLNWIFAWILPLAAFSGGYYIVTEWLKEKKFKAQEFQRLVLVGGLVAAWSSLLAVKSLFIQYYIPTTWFFAILAAVAVSTLIRLLPNKKLTMIFVAIIFLILANQSFTANQVRATSRGEDFKQMITRRWQQIPENQPVFPDFLFRPSVYPISFGYGIGEIPEPILRRFIPISRAIEDNSLPFVLIDSYQLNLLPMKDKTYIETNFRSISPSDPDYRVRTTSR